MGMFTNSAAAELGRRTIVTGITKNWVTPVVKAAARSRRAVIRLMLCRQYDASARSKTAAANQECAATVRSALRAHRSQLERKCGHNCCRSSGVIRHANGVNHLAAAPRGQGIPSLRHPVSGAGCTADATKEPALAGVVRAPTPATQEERTSLARARAAVAVELANPGRDAHWLGDAFTFDEIRNCLSSLKNHKAEGNDGNGAGLLNYTGGTANQVLMHILNAINTAHCVPSGWSQGVVVGYIRATFLKEATHETALTTDRFRSFRLSTSCLPSSTQSAFRVLFACPTRTIYAFRPGRGTLNPLQNLLAVVRQRTQANKVTYACFFYAAKAYESAPYALRMGVQITARQHVNGACVIPVLGARPTAPPRHKFLLTKNCASWSFASSQQRCCVPYYSMHSSAYRSWRLLQYTRTEETLTPCKVQSTVGRNFRFCFAWPEPASYGVSETSSACMRNGNPRPP